MFMGCSLTLMLNGMFVCCCLILLDTLLFVNATAFNIRFYPD